LPLRQPWPPLGGDLGVLLELTEERNERPAVPLLRDG
jgi:hypothetical protein